jgi:hypothetical protein
MDDPLFYLKPPPVIAEMRLPTSHGHDLVLSVHDGGDFYASIDGDTVPRRIQPEKLLGIRENGARVEAAPGLWFMRRGELVHVLPCNVDAGAVHARPLAIALGLLIRSVGA